jgi:hypothetical protein
MQAPATTLAILDKEIAVRKTRLVAELSKFLGYIDWVTIDGHAALLLRGADGCNETTLGKTNLFNQSMTRPSEERAAKSSFVEEITNVTLSTLNATRVGALHL